MGKHMVCVVLVNYNGKKYNRACIDSILRNTYRGKVKIVVVDNASSDGSLEELEKIYADIDNIYYIRMKENGGFSKANNEGIKWALEQHYRHILLLNNDTEIEPWTIEKMVQLQEKTGHIVVPKILYADMPNIIWCAGGELSPLIKKPRHRGAGKPDGIRFDGDNICTFANGCCILLSDQIIYKMGLLDERFFLYYEDTEYSMRASRNKIVISYCGKAVVYHKVNGSTGGNANPANVYYITRNWLMCNRGYMRARFILFVIYFVLNRLCWAAIWLLTGRREMIKAMWQGIFDFKNGKTGRL